MLGRALETKEGLREKENRVTQVEHQRLRSRTLGQLSFNHQMTQLHLCTARPCRGHLLVATFPEAQ